MPYFITDQSTECQGWAVVKSDGEVMGCHTNKTNAVDQMVAISLAEGIEPGGERDLPDNYRPALSPDVPEGRACGNCVHYEESNIQGDKAWCEQWDEYVSGAYYCNAWQSDEYVRQVDISVPIYVRDAAQRGLDLLRDGYGGDGLADATIREARQMASGEMSEDKVIRANAWAARHAIDLEAGQNSDLNHPDWPGPGAVAHYLWGINPTDPGPARRWLQRQVDRINAARNHMTTVERRDIHVQDFEMRSDGMSFSGYAAVFDSPSQPLPFTEVIAAGAFKRTLTRRNNIRMLLNHDTSRVLGTTRSGTLRLHEDSKGLHVEADLPETTYGRDLSIVMQRGDVDAMSFGFSVPPKGDRWSDDGATRTLTEVRLHEVSVVTFPAYEATTAHVRDYSLLASRYDADVDAIADALSALESGTLNEEQATLLRNLLSAPNTDVVDKQSTNLGLLQKQLDLKKYDI
jgi:HK97 family phage prohead protease